MITTQPLKQLHNPKTGMRLEILRSPSTSGDQNIEWIATYIPHSVEPPGHSHPHQEEFFKIRTGTMSFRLDGKITVLKEGDTLHVPAGKVHSMWNSGPIEASVLWKTTPALGTEQFFKKLFELAEQRRTDQQGRPGLFQGAVLMHAYRREFRLAKPPLIMQRLLFGPLALIGHALGFRSR